VRILVQQLLPKWKS